jgi:hypothetical protein
MGESLGRVPRIDEEGGEWRVGSGEVWNMTSDVGPRGSLALEAPLVVDGGIGGGETIMIPRPQWGHARRHQARAGVAKQDGRRAPARRGAESRGGEDSGSPRQSSVRGHQRANRV